MARVYSKIMSNGRPPQPLVPDFALIARQAICDKSTAVLHKYSRSVTRSRTQSGKFDGSLDGSIDGSGRTPVRVVHAPGFVLQPVLGFVARTGVRASTYNQQSRSYDLLWGVFQVGGSRTGVRVIDIPDSTQFPPETNIIGDSTNIVGRLYPMAPPGVPNRGSGLFSYHMPDLTYGMRSFHLKIYSSCLM